MLETVLEGDTHQVGGGGAEVIPQWFEAGLDDLQGVRGEPCFPEPVVAGTKVRRIV